MIVAVIADIIVVKSKKENNSTDITVSEETKENNEDREKTEEKVEEVEEEAKNETVNETVQAQDNHVSKEDEYFYADVYNYLTLRSEPSTSGLVLYELPGYISGEFRGRLLVCKRC